MNERRTERGPGPLAGIGARPGVVKWCVAIPRTLAPYWLDLLQRSGVPMTLLGDEGARGTVGFCAGLDLARDRVAHDHLRALWRAGVPLVLDARAFASLTGRDAETVRVERVSGDGRLFADANAVRLPMRLAIPGGARFGWVSPQGRAAIAIDESGAAPLIGLPLPEVSAIEAATPRLVRFPLSRGRHATEIVSACDHAGVRRLVENALAVAAHAVGLPFVRFAPAPGDHLGAFAVRIDADSYDPGATERTLDALARGAVRATWFLDVARHARLGGATAVPKLLAAGHEVQSHHWRHYTFRSRARSRANLARSFEVLRAWGVEATAAAAPFGSWNVGLDAAMRELGIAWSSEFSRCHDDIPGAGPHSGAADGGWLTDPPWQVPTHPVCPALMLDAGLSPDEVAECYARLIRSRLLRGEPAVIYGHPIDDIERVPGLFAALDETLGELERVARIGAVWQPTLGELCAFHRARRHQAIACRVGEDSVEGEVRGPAGLWIDLPDGSRVRTGPGRFVVRLDRNCLTRVPASSGNEVGTNGRAGSVEPSGLVLARLRMGISRWKREVLSRTGER